MTMTEEIEIRDRRNGQWAWVNNSVIADPHLTPAEKVTYMALATFAGYQEIKPSVPDLATRCSVSIRTVRMAIKRLEEVGYLQVDRRNDYSPSKYSLLKAVNGCNSCHTPGSNCTPVKSAPLQKTTGDPGKKQHKTPAESAPTIDKEIDSKYISSPSAPPSIQKSNFKLQPPSPSDLAAAVKRVWDYHLERLGNNGKIRTFTTLRKQKGLDRLKEALKKTGGDLSKAEELMRIAVDAIAVSPWHCGENPSGKKYQSWENHMFRTAEQFETRLEQAQ